MARKISNQVLTAYVLGELKTDTKKEIDLIVEQDPNVRAAVESMRAIVDITTQAFGDAREAHLELTDDQRTQVRLSAQSASSELFSNQGGIFDTPASESSPPDFSGNIFNTPPPGSLSADLFSSLPNEGDATGESIDPAPATGLAPERNQVGQRHENSVLFSLANLQDVVRASTTAQRPDTPQVSKDEASGLIDIRSLAQIVTAQSTTEGPAADFHIAPGAFAPVLAPKQQKSKVLMPLAIAASVVLSIISGAIIMNTMSETAPMDTSETDAKIAQLTELLAKMQAGDGAANLDETQDLQEEIALLEAKKAAEAATLDIKEEATEIARTTPTAKKSIRRSAKSSKSTSRSTASKPKPVAAKKPASSESDLDDLLGGSETNKPPAKIAAKKPSANETTDLPTNPTKAQVKSAMSKVASRVKQCGRGQTGTLKIKVVIHGPTGRVKSAKTTSGFAGTPTGSCAERAVKGARFPKFKRKALSVTYPFKL